MRIAGIGAPASKASDAGSSRAGLRRLVSGKTVRVEANALDPKGVLVGSVHVVANDCIDPCPPLVDPGLVQLANGMAVIDKTNLSWQSSGAQERYLSAQAQAKAGRLGVWRDPRYEPGR